MISSKDCYLSDQCWKYLNTDADCKEADIYCPKLFRVDHLYEEALLSPIQRRHTPLHIDEDGTDLEAFKRLKEIEKHIDKFVGEGKNLYIHSSTCGNGKTEWSVRLLQAYIGKIWHKSDIRCRALFISVSKYFIALKESISVQSDYITHIKNNILDADLVIFDDLATKVGTTFELENLLSIVDTRINFGKSNIYTSNVSGNDLRDRIGDRLYSRVIHTSENIEFFGSDKRGMT